MLWFKRVIYDICRNVAGYNYLIKFIEYIRGLYRYPGSMLGRIMPAKLTEVTDVLVIAAHPDDEILGLSSMLGKHRMNGDMVTIVYVTNGSVGKGPSWKCSKMASEQISKRRYEEGARALSHIGIKKGNLLCLGFPDGGTHRYLVEMAKDIIKLINDLNPKKIYVHSIEGGHDDHDIVSFVVKSVCKQLGSLHLYEWAEYNRLQPLGSKNINFRASIPSKYKETIMHLTKEEQKLKKKMLENHESQGVVVHYMMGEAIRQADFSNLETNLYEYSHFAKRGIKPLVKRFLAYLHNHVVEGNKKSAA